MKARLLAAAVTLLLVGGATAACGEKDAQEQPASMPAHATKTQSQTQSQQTTPELAAALAKARAATAKYVSDLPFAQQAGYQIITPMMPGMGYHYLNPKAPAFDLTAPAILVYVKNDNRWELGALEWVWPEQPTGPPLPGATYGEFAAACHYQDGTFVPADAEADCARTNGGEAFGFWHPKLVTMHVWLWFHNPDGLFHPTNPLVQTA
ncbi:hypothetical protein Ais01nite_56660 [Asanoa ishikariensis]|uniref:Uncharacterized protein n=1 Tax=Asanoa ishikariensis TaxID=137265 RepID=A0A1H3TYK4_9ACTN|nr:hypothetical protein [Asanoa ishikariensis]GIF67631.1 hypothetical protein Ais01nite_56660 [Asanoa ishikariensis]SDZ54755.1 hypothetical protein SAMN05421684_6527 [Asanoa ishikariensis]